MTRKNSTTVDRKFYYYDIDIYVYDETCNTVTQSNYQCQELYSAFTYLKDIQDRIMASDKQDEKFELQKELEVLTITDDKIYIIIDKIEDNKPIEFRIVLCRRSALPFIEKNGILTFLSDHLSGDFSLAEITHCVIFPDKNIMGAEFNYSGARPTAIANYLMSKIENIKFITCRGKLSKDALNKYIEREDLSLFELSFKNDDTMKLGMMNKMSGFFTFFAQFPDVDTFDIVLKRRKTKKKGGFQSPLSKVELTSFLEEYKDGICKFKISQGAYKDCIDLLSDKLVHTSSFITTENHTIKAEDAYREIENFFESTVKHYCPN